jgi:hypothetical protein
VRAFLIMTPVPRRQGEEEIIVNAVGTGLRYLVWIIKQLILMLPSLWAGYELGRRRDERRRAGSREGARNATRLMLGIPLNITSANNDTIWVDDEIDSETGLDEGHGTASMAADVKDMVATLANLCNGLYRNSTKYIIDRG